MNKAYILITGSDVTRESVTDFLNDLSEISHWYACLPHCVFFTSSLPAENLASKLLAAFPQKRILVMETNINSQGWLPPEAWHLMNNPQSPRMAKAAATSS